MQRVRIGLTGLALVFLLVLLGAVIRSVSNDEPAPVNVTEQSSSANAAANGEQSAEPLARLGVAPGSSNVGNETSGPSRKK